MKLNQGDTAYDFLAVLCSMLPKEQERKCAIKWKTAGYNKVEKAIKEYQKYVDIILKSSLETRDLVYDQAVCQINQFLEQAEEPDEQMMNEIYLLAVRIEKQLSACTELICEGDGDQTEAAEQKLQGDRDQYLPLFCTGMGHWKV